MLQRRLTLRAHLNNYSGYGTFVCQIFHWLTKKNIFLAIRPTTVDEQWGKTSSIPKEMKGQIVHSRQPEPWEMIICTPDTGLTPQRKTAFFSMYESSELPLDYVRNFNKTNLVIVPCTWCADSFAQSGVTVPIEICPLGFDPEVFSASPMNMTGPTVFGVAGRTRHCAKRKGIQEAIELFVKTFPNVENVRLHVKVHPDDEAKCTDPRVKITKAHFEPYEIAQWLSNLTAYVTLSRGEGFGLWPLQAMACGRPVIGAKFSGQADFLTADNAYIVPHRVIDAVSGESNVEYLGHWANLDYKIAARHMMVIHQGRQQAARIGEVAAESIKDWTWERAADRLIQILENAGAL